MPTYEYRCRDCGHSFDIVQKMSDATLTHCPECGGELRKVFTPPAISFKGSGFYATDHGKKSKPAGDSTDKDVKKESKPSEGATSDTKKTDSSSSSSSPSTTTKKEGSS